MKEIVAAIIAVVVLCLVLAIPLYILRYLYLNIRDGFSYRRQMNKARKQGKKDAKERELQIKQGKELLLQYEQNSTKKDKILSFSIAGIYYKDGATKGIASRLIPGQELTLRREPKNKYDNNAVEILYGNIPLGYVPSYHAEEISEMLSKYRPYKLFIEEVAKNPVDFVPMIDVKLFPL